jgi:SAM-dependent methyltransferase
MESEAGNPLERFFNEITPLVYDLQFRPDAPDVAFWVDWCREVGGPVLELGCGNGRVTIPLARAGLNVVGIDLSEPMLKVARQRLAAEPREVRERVRLRREDMRDFRAGVTFACAIIPASTFAVLLTRPDQERTLASLRAGLAENGGLAFDLRVFDDWIESRQLPPLRRASANGSVDFTEERRFEFDPCSRIITSISTYTFHAPAHLGCAVEHQQGLALSRAEVEEILGGAGFAVETVWGDYDRQPHAAGDAKMIFVARRER